jgi:DNA polymerase-3 subunit chi
VADLEGGTARLMRADFYLVTKPRFREEPLRLVCELARKAHDSGQSCLILARDAQQAEALDDLLWEFDPDAYLPHQIAGQDEDDDDTPLLIVAPGTDTPDRPLVINLRDEVAPGSYERVLEVVPADAEAREPLRQRWREYQSRGAQLAKHDM